MTTALVPLQGLVMTLLMRIGPGLLPQGPHVESLHQMLVSEQPASRAPAPRGIRCNLPLRQSDLVHPLQHSGRQWTSRVAMRKPHSPGQALLCMLCSATSFAGLKVPHSP